MSDITYIGTLEGWLYLAVILDLFSRKVVGWKLGETLEGRLWISLGASLLVVSDRGNKSVITKENRPTHKKADTTGRSAV